jgi:hypothetical protein
MSLNVPAFGEFPLACLLPGRRATNVDPRLPEGLNQEPGMVAVEFAGFDRGNSDGAKLDALRYPIMPAMVN